MLNRPSVSDLIKIAKKERFREHLKFFNLYQTPHPNDVKGKYLIGYTENNMPVFLNPEELFHTISLGATRSGKTNLIFVLLSQIMKEHPCLIIDVAKETFRALIRNKDIKNLLVIPWNLNKRNDLREVNGQNLEEYGNKFCKIFTQSFKLQDASQAVLRDSLFELYQKFNSFNSEHRPTLVDLHNYLDSKKARRLSYTDRGYLDRITSKSSFFTRGTIRDVVHNEYGFPVEVFINNNIVVELHGLESPYDYFFANLDIERIKSFKECNYHREPYGIIIDEASSIIGLKHGLMEESIISKALRRAAEYGIFLILADQLISSLEDTVLANCYTKMFLHQSSGKEIRIIKESIGLTKEQAEILMHLTVGKAVVKLSGKYTEPFLISIPHYPTEIITDEETEELMRDRIEALPFKKAEEEIIEFKENIEARAVKTIQKNPDWNKILNSIIEKPLNNNSMRAELLDYGKTAFSRIIGDMVKAKLIVNHNVSLPKQGGRSSFLELTKAGFEYIGQPINKLNGKGTFETKMIVNLVAHKFIDEGYKTIIEHYRNGKAIDILLIKDNKEIAIEIANGRGNREIVNILKDIMAGYNEIWMLSRTKQIENEIKEEMKENLNCHNVKFFMIKDFI